LVSSQDASRVLSVFLLSMGLSTKSELDEETRLSHLRALIAMQMAGQRQEMTLMNKVRARSVLFPLTRTGSKSMHDNQAGELRWAAG
jgi:hypothetical protein